MKRFLKIVGILALFAAVLFYLAFRVLFFDPFEGSFGAVTSLAPRDATFFLRRSQPGRDFHEFPHLDAFEGLKLRREWKEFAGTNRFEEWRRSLDLGALLEEIERGVEDAKSALDIQSDVLGEEMLVIGRRRADQSVGIAAAFRASFKVKFYAEAVQSSLFRPFVKDFVTSCIDSGDGISSLLVQGQTIHLLRLQDLVIGADDLELLRDIAKLARGEGVGLDDSQYFATAMAQDSETGRSLDFAVQVGELAREFGWASLPADDESSVAWKLLSQCLQPGDFGMAAGKAFLGADVDLRMHLGGDMTQIISNAGGFLSGASGELQSLYDFCGRSFPKTVFACGAARLTVDSLLTRLESNLDDATRKDLQDFLEQVNQRAKFQGKSVEVGSVAELVRRFAATFGNEIAFALEPQSAYQIKGEPDLRVPNSSWGPRIAMCFPLADPSTARTLIDLLVDTINGNGATVFRSSYAGFDQYSFRELEFDVFEVPSIAVGFLDLEGRDHLVLTTTGAFLDEMCRERINRVQGVASGLGETLHYQQARRLAEGYGQAFFYLQSEGLVTSWKQYAPFEAETLHLPDQRALRDELEREVRDREYPEHRGKPVTAEERRELASLVDTRFEEWMGEWRNKELPRKIEEIEREMAVAKLLRWAGATLRVNERDVFLRSVINSPMQFR